MSEFMIYARRLERTCTTGVCMHKFIYENVRYVLDRRKYTYSLLLLDKNIFLTNMANPFPNKKHLLISRLFFF